MPLVYSVPALGGYTAAASIDSEVRQRSTKTTYFHQATGGCASFGKHRSNQLLFDKIGRIATVMDVAGLGEVDPVPETTMPLVQGSITATEYANSIAWTEKLETYSQFPIGQMVALALRQDQIEGLDKVAFAAYALGRVVYTPQTASTGVFSTTGTAGAIAGSAMTVTHCRDISDYLRNNNVPAMAGGAYMGIVHIDHIRGVKETSEFIDVAKYHAPEKLFNSEVGQYANIRFLEENNALASPAGTNAAGFAQGVYFGADNGLEAVAQAPHLRYGIPQDFGRDRREGHFYNGGFVLAWRFDTDGGEEHQVRADSL